MRIPWYFTVPLCIIVLITGLYLGSSNRDFVTPTSDEDKAKNVESWRATKPSLKDTKLAKPEEAKPEEPAPIVEPKVTPKPSLPVFDPSSIKIDTSLTLDQFKDLDLKLVDRLDHASFLVSQKDYQAAHLAFERIIDTAKDTTPEQTQLAAKAISELPKSESLFRPDPSMRKTLTINIKLEAKLVTKAQEIKDSLENSLLKSSSGLITPKIIISKAAERPGLPTLNSLHITSGSDKKTPTIRFSSSTDAETLIYKAIYNSLRNTALSDEDLKAPLALGDTKLSAKEALPIFITRYTWLKLIESL